MSRLDALVDLVVARLKNAQHNIYHTFADLTSVQAIRLVVIVCAYLLLRPYLVRGAGTKQRAQLERESLASVTARLQPNDLRGSLRNRRPPPSPVEEEGEEWAAEEAAQEASRAAGDWGERARARQRRVVRQLIDAEEKRLKAAAGDDEDKDIEEFLTQ